jgi:thiamine-phosphate pyrophosphorylase
MRNVLLYYITDRTQFSGNEAARQNRLLQKIAEAARCGIDFVQLREKDLAVRDLEKLAFEAVRVIRESSQAGSRERRTRLLVNSRTDVAISSGADGVHLRSSDLLPANVRKIWTASAHPGTDAEGRLEIGVSCHTFSEVANAGESGATFAVFGPIFEKKGARGIRTVGLGALQQPIQHKIPIFAVGGVNFENAQLCVDAGAAGIAAIRLFQENEVGEVVRRLRSTRA